MYHMHSLVDKPSCLVDLCSCCQHTFLQQYETRSNIVLKMFTKRKKYLGGIYDANRMTKKNTFEGPCIRDIPMVSMAVTALVQHLSWPWWSSFNSTPANADEGPVGAPTWHSPVRIKVVFVFCKGWGSTIVRTYHVPKLGRYLPHLTLDTLRNNKNTSNDINNSLCNVLIPKQYMPTKY